MYSLIGSAKLNGLDPEGYFATCLSESPTTPSTASTTCSLGRSPPSCNSKRLWRPEPLRQVKTVSTVRLLRGSTSTRGSITFTRIRLPALGRHQHPGSGSLALGQRVRSGSCLRVTSPSGLGTFTLNPRFPEQYFDAEPGLQYNYYRDYDPLTGRYV
jgi:hypothetical protein